MKSTIRGLFLFLALSSNSSAGNLFCLDNQSQSLPVKNEQIMIWKKTTKDQFTTRALAKGTVTQIFAHKPNHTHFAINIDADAGGDLEVIYNDDFGQLPTIKVGQTITACGDYKTTPRSSPMGAIIHWLHYNPGNQNPNHKHGFLMINGKVYGTAPKVLVE